MSGSHGGSVALSGYLYQFLAVTGVQVSAGPGQSNTPDDEAFLTVHEWLDEDGAVRSSKDKSVTFVQVKYSQKGKAAKIEPAELKEIARRFALATREAEAKGWNVSGYLVVSNRGFSPGSKKLVNNPKACRPSPKSLTKSKIKKSEPWNEYHEQITECIVDLVWSQKELDAQLKNFAGQYGVLDDEFKKAIKELIGEIVTDVAHLTESGLTLKDLIAFLTTERNAVSLVKSEQLINQRNEIDRIKLSDGTVHVQRASTSGLFKTYPQHSIFVFYGNGGMGKSASLRELAEKESAPTEGPFIRGDIAPRARANWAKVCADKWRKVTPPSPEQDIERAIQRLQRANPTIVPPVLLIALDGIDENLEQDTKNDLAELIDALSRSFNPLSLTSTTNYKLLVTCRELKEFRSLAPQNDPDFGAAPSNWYVPIPFEPFDPDEFREIVTKEAGRLRDRLAPKLTVSSSASVNSDNQIIQLPPTTQYDYLRDPLVWRAFASLDPARQDDVLDGKAPAIISLGEMLFTRFTDKAIKRRKELDAEILLKVMKAVALDIDAVPSPWKRNNWTLLGVKSGVSLHSQCETIFHEALNAGIITGHVDNWTWRIAAVPKYLKNAC